MFDVSTLAADVATLLVSHLLMSPHSSANVCNVDAYSDVVTLYFSILLIVADIVEMSQH